MRFAFDINVLTSSEGNRGKSPVGLSLIPDHGRAGLRGREETNDVPAPIVMPAEAGIHGPERRAAR